MAKNEYKQALCRGACKANFCARRAQDFTFVIIRVKLKILYTNFFWGCF